MRIGIGNPPGELWQVGKHRLHCVKRGSGAPTVLFEAGMPASCVNWMILVERLASTTTVVAYDRAGFGWSEAGPLPRTSGRILDELQELLGVAGIEGPLVLVGHSFGSFTVRLFAALYPERVAGLVLIDPIVPEDWVTPDEARQRQILSGVTGCRRGELMARWGIAAGVERLVALGATGAARGVIDFLTNGGARNLERRTGPYGKIHPDYRAVARKLLTYPRYYQAMGSQIEHLPYSAEEVLATAHYGSYPVAVLSAGTCGERDLLAHVELARRYPMGRHLMAIHPGTGFIWMSRIWQFA